MHVAGVLTSTPSTSIYLSSEQTDKLRRVLDRIIPIYPSPPNSSFPTLHIVPRDFLRSVLIKLAENSIEISSIRLNGGAASYVLVNDSDFVYRDIDILFLVLTPLSNEIKTNLFSSNGEEYFCDVWTIIKYVICLCLLEHISNASSTTLHSNYTLNLISSLLDTYAKKNIKISGEQDSWALLSLQNLLGQNLELKFVERLKRQWQFSVDSFQIHLEPLLLTKGAGGSGSSTTTTTTTTTTSSIRTAKRPSISSITKTITTKNLTIEAINGLTIIKSTTQNDAADDKDNRLTNNITSNNPMTSTSPLQFGFFTPSSSPEPIDVENNIECRTLATITTIATTNENNPILEPRSRSSKNSSSTTQSNDPVNAAGAALQFHISVNDDVDDGIEVDADDSAGEDDDQVFCTPIDAVSTSSSPSIVTTTTRIEATTPRPPSPPLIEVCSVYNDVHEALNHLNNKLIATYAPETMRGGGLLKYCDLLARNYKPYDMAVMAHMQRYMCSRFFIDYKTIPEQTHVIAQYITTHFLPSSSTSATHTNAHHHHPHPYSHSQRRYHSSQSKSNKQSLTTIDQTDVINARLCSLFLDNLWSIIMASTVCLTTEDKHGTLRQIDFLYNQYRHEYQHLLMEENHSQLRNHYYPHHHHHHNNQHNSSSSSNSSRSSSPSGSSYTNFRYNNNNSHRQQMQQQNNHRQQQQQRQSSYYYPSSYHGTRHVIHHNQHSHHDLNMLQTVPLQYRRYQS